LISSKNTKDKIAYLNKLLFFGLLSISKFSPILYEQQGIFFGFFSASRRNFLQIENKDLDYFFFKHLFDTILVSFPHDFSFQPSVIYDYDQIIVNFFFLKALETSQFFPENNFIENWKYSNSLDDLLELVDKILEISKILEKEELFAGELKTIFEEKKLFLLGFKDLQSAINSYNKVTDNLEVSNINDTESNIKNFLSLIEKSRKNIIIKSNQKNEELLKKI